MGLPHKASGLESFWTGRKLLINKSAYRHAACSQCLHSQQAVKDAVMYTPVLPPAPVTNTRIGMVGTMPARPAMAESY